MERLSERDRVLPSYAYRDPFGNLHHTPPSSSWSHHRSSDVDFADVFGGPPRRSSFYELRRARADSLDTRSRPRPSSLGLAAERPVFGEVGSPSRRNINDEFYDDIFPGSDSGSSTPMRLDRDPFPSAPGSRVLSPNRPVFVGGSSLPPHPSLPKAKSARGVDYPSLGSPAHSAPFKGDDGDSDASSLPHSPNPFRADDPRNSGYAFYRQSPLASQLSRGTTVRPLETFVKGSQSERYTTSVENYINSNRFHFSVYRWAGKGVSLRLSSLSKETNGVSRYIRMPEVVIHSADLPSADEDDDMSASTGVSSNQIENEGKNILSDIFMEGKHGAASTIPEDILPESDSSDISRTTGNSGAVKKDATDNFGVKQQAQRQNSVEHVGTVKASKGVPVSLDEKMHESRVKGRVKEFIKIFNVDGSPKRKGLVDSGARKPKEKDRTKSKVDDQVSASAAEAEAKAANHREEISGTDSVELNEFLKTSGIPSLYMKSNVPVTEDSSERTNTSGPNPAPTQENAEAAVQNVEESSFEDFDECLVEQLSQEHTENQQADVHQDQIQVANAKIRDWSKGREGNIRSLLSTLQYVLWSESGWKPVPLVDIIEGASVKRAYQRALLCLHPDKLQQRGAAEHQKHIAEKVFDILQEAWEQFNSITGVY